MIQTTIALILFLFPLAYSPGPGNLFFAANGARFGFRSTVPANAGYHAATWIVTAGIGFGFISAFDRFPNAFLTVKIAGSVYVLWIAWKLFRSGVLREGGIAKPATFVDGAVLLLLNPKAYVIIALMFTQFLDPASEQLVAVLLISTVFTFNNLVAFSVWTLVGDRISLMFRTPESAHRLNMTFGALLAIVGVWMLFS